MKKLIKTFLPYVNDDGREIEPPKLAGRCDYCLSDMHETGSVNAVGVYACTNCNYRKRYLSKVDRAIRDALIEKLRQEQTASCV